jgi:hypothetical protein
MVRGIISRRPSIIRVNGRRHGYRRSLADECVLLRRIIVKNSNDLSVRRLVAALTCAVFAIALLASTRALAAGGAEAHTTGLFAGVKVNGGTATHSKEGGKNVLTLSDDFKVPDTPAPHWQVVDSKGNVYLLQRLVVKGDKYNKQIVVPPYVRDIAKVQIWCAWAETLLGETTFPAPVK